MVTHNRHRPFSADPAQIALKPAISGNAINGLGEARPRQPSVVYWAPDPDTIPHGAMQRWFYGVDPDNSHLKRAREERAKQLSTVLPDVMGEPVRRRPEEWNASLAELAGRANFDMWGVTKMNPLWVYSGQDVFQQNIIVLGFAHDYEQIATAPEATAGAEVVRQYGRAAAAAKLVSGWLREQGWDAEPLTGPMTSKVMMIPPAIAAGFGELGKHGSLINAELGSSFRLSAVLTDAPFAPTPQRTFEVDSFCLNCRVCENACPPEAISADKQVVRGVEKWYVDFDKCLPFFNQTHGCAICIAVCPWSRPGVGLALAEKLSRRAVGQRHDR
ncbi:4Fe-4S dicluster domain-containing protein [Bradyrhizobium japonicum]|uniref:4Fe-4S dicluster domain-containing protein n=1 Tax=Bradyrhizobium japonicum TaxID=375 RepID=UPI001BAA2DD2|nr:4Fe-4S dicluster domain-containing protein [Bradyrhizobium japonicum]MBR0733192.1 4Fe-4S dicluster domain-containing protein [Bradyrhizobium japonicum]